MRYFRTSVSPARLGLVTLLSACSVWAETITTYAPGTALENVAISTSGDLFVSSIFDGTIYRVSPSGTSQVFAQVAGPVLGVAFNNDGTLVAVGGSNVYRFAPDGTPALVTDIAGAQDLNGLTPLKAGVFLVADDAADIVWQVDLHGNVSPWLTSSLLIPTDPNLPIGPNGVKLFAGAAYISVTGSGTILRVPIAPDGSAGTPEVYASSLPADDFAFAADGTIFAATEVGQIVRLNSDGSTSSIATGTLGDAALAFGRTNADRNDIYIVNNGGVFLGIPGGPEAASILRLPTNETGVAPESQVAPEPASVCLRGAGIGILVLVRHRRRKNRDLQRSRN